MVFTAVIEKCPETGLYVGYIPGFPGAHSQGETLDELNKNLQEVVEMLLEDGDPKLGKRLGTSKLINLFNVRSKVTALRFEFRI